LLDSLIPKRKRKGKEGGRKKEGAPDRIMGASTTIPALLFGKGKEEEQEGKKEAHTREDSTHFSSSTGKKKRKEGRGGRRGASA